jgi:hypothetical protein
MAALAMPVGQAHGGASLPMIRAGAVGRGGIVGAPGGIVRVLPHSIGSIFSGLSPAALANAITKALVSGFFHSLLSWVADGAVSLVGVVGSALSSTTAPVLGASAFGSEFALMAVLSAAVALPLVAVAAVQAIVRQEPGSLLRSVLVRLPLALLFTGVSVQMVALGLTATDQASAILIGADGDPAHHLLTGLVSGLAQPAGLGLAAFAEFLLMLSAGFVAFLLWLELVVRSAAIAAASLFLPLALVGLAWPATSHWARRLGETLAALVLSKLVIAAVLALAAGLLVGASGLAEVVQGVALLAIAAFAPFALLKLVPVLEAGAIAHFEGTSRRPIRVAERFGSQVLGLEGGGVAALASLGGLVTRAAEAPVGGGDGPSQGPWHEFREEYAAVPTPADGAEHSGTPPSPIAPVARPSSSTAKDPLAGVAAIPVSPPAGDAPALADPPLVRRGPKLERSEPDHG